MTFMNIVRARLDKLRGEASRARGECECPEDHSVGKLGHSDVCPWFGAFPPTLTIDHNPCVLADSVHDFEYATYSGATISTGVCRCGVREIDYWIARGP